MMHARSSKLKLIDFQLTFDILCLPTAKNIRVKVRVAQLDA